MSNHHHHHSKNKKGGQHEQVIDTNITIKAASSDSIMSTSEPGGGGAIKLIDSLKAFQVKVETVLSELARHQEQNGGEEAANRLNRWLVKMNDYLRTLCSGFRARLLAPMAALPEMKLPQREPLSASLMAMTKTTTTVDLHRIYHSLKCAVLEVPELLLVTHLFASNQVFCSSLSELLAESERELWQQQADAAASIDECRKQLAKMVTAVNRLLQCTRIAGDWLQQHDQQQNVAGGGSGGVSVETTRLQRLISCQKLLRLKLEVIDDELSSLDFELSDATNKMKPLLELQDGIEEATNGALGINASSEHVIRRIKAIETEILQHKNKHQPAPRSELMTNNNGTKTNKSDNPNTAVTMSQVCHQEISAAQRKLRFLDYLKTITLEDVEDSCMTMPFVVRQADYMQSIVDRIEAAVDDKQAARLHLQNTLAFISQEAECATHLCGQVELGGFTAALGVNQSVITTSSSPIDATKHIITRTSEVSSQPFSGGADKNSKSPPGPVVYIKRRHHSQSTSQQSSNADSNRR